MHLVLYGPPGSGKTAVGKILADWMDREFVDTDAFVEARSGRAIRAIFAEEGEAAFRRLEAEAAREISAREGLVIACGGGLMLDPANRAALESRGQIVVLKCDPDEILSRLSGDPAERPLIQGGGARARLMALLDARRTHYDSFALQVDTSGLTPQAAAEAAIGLSGELVTLRVQGPLGHDYLLGRGVSARLDGMLAARGLKGLTAVVTDSNLAANLAPKMGFAEPIVVPAGEQHKSLESARMLYNSFLDRGLDRQSVVVAFGGGVIGDLAGYAAATFMRGIAWVVVPTTLLAMVDSSLGGKVGVDLPRGKNLVGAFHSPAFVLADLDSLESLPDVEYRSGMAEVVKAGVVGDQGLFEGIEKGELGIRKGEFGMVRRAVQVKARVVGTDPFERGERAVLNLGHTVAHGLEAASNYSLRHGEAVAIGMAAEARMAAALGMCAPDLPERIQSVLMRIGLPVRCRGLDPQAVRKAMSVDKKKAGGQLKFALPREVGQVQYGVEVGEVVLDQVLREIREEVRHNEW